jgi:hypothetical protein
MRIDGALPQVSSRTALRNSQLDFKPAGDAVPAATGIYGVMFSNPLPNFLAKGMKFRRDTAWPEDKFWRQTNGRAIITLPRMSR